MIVNERQKKDGIVIRTNAVQIYSITINMVMMETVILSK
jgi:hypothetical protein